MGEGAGVASLVNAIKASGQSKDLELGRRLHSQAVCCGVDRNKFVANCLVSMYARCGSMADAHRVFEGIAAEENVSLGVLINGYVHRGEPEAALECFSRMNGVDSRSLVAALTACAQLASKESEPDDKLKWLHKGMALHFDAVQRGMVSDDHICVQTTLLNLCAKCGNMALARDVFDRMQAYSVVSWAALLHGYVDNGDFQMALELYEGIADGRIACFIPEGNGRVFIAGLLACTNLAAAAAATVVKDVNGISSSRNQSSKFLWLEKGKAIHSQAMMHGCTSDLYVESTLINMYSKCGSLAHARSVFDNMHKLTPASWNVMLQTYVENGKSELVLELFDGATEQQGLIFDSRSYAIAIAASAALLAKEQTPETGSQRWLEKAKAIHSQAVRSNCCNLYVETALIEMYGRCGKMLHARALFDSMVEQNTVTCCTLLQGYVANGDNELGLEVFEAMDDACWGRTNIVSYIAALTACANLAEEIKNQQQEKRLNLLEKGKALHSRAVMAGHCDKKVKNKLVSLYGKCGGIVHAQCVFDNLFEQSIVSWNALIMGYAAAGENEVALKLIALMDSAGCALHSSTFVAGLVACTNSANFEQGRAFHAEAYNFGLEQHHGVADALISFYAKCGSMDSAKQVFDSLLFKPVDAWNSMLNGYALHGNTSLVFELFDSMREQKVAPNKITFLYILSACRHAGLIDKGKSYFQLMQEKYQICPDEIHRTCMVDLLATGNHMSEALQVLRSMAYEDTRVAWTSVLSACRRWNNVEVGKLAYDALLKLNWRAASTYDLMASIHAAAGS